MRETGWTRGAYAGMRLGLFVHYVYAGLADYSGGWIGLHRDGPATTLDALADGLDVEDLARSAEAMGAEYVIFTAWHANMNLLYPSAAMARRRPGHSARRDVIADLLAALHARGIELILYVHPCDGHDFPADDQEALGWNAPPYDRWHAFIRDVFTELTERYRGQLLGLWFDGGTPPQVDGVLDELRALIRRIDPGLVVIQNEGFDPNYFRRWADEGCRECLAHPYPSNELQVAAVITGNWWAYGTPLLWTPELAYQYLVLQAATQGNRGGVAYSTGPYAGGQWEAGVTAFFSGLGNHIRPVAESLFGTRPSMAYPIVPGTTLEETAWAATESADGAVTYLHVLRTQARPSLRLPAPADGRRFTRAVQLRTGKTLELTQDAAGITLTMSAGAWWETLDTVIVLS